MATVPKKVCDLCRSDRDIEECVVVYRYGKSRPWGVDLCQACYDQRMGDLIKLSHTVKRANIRPQYKMVESVLTPEQLGELNP